MTSLTNLGVTETLHSFRLVLERKTDAKIRVLTKLLYSPPGRLIKKL